MTRLIRRTISLLTALVFASLSLSGGQASAGTLISAHSHWDIHLYKDHEIKACYAVQSNATGFGSEIMHLPFREVDNLNQMDLHMFTTGFTLVRRVAGVSTTITPDPAVPNPNLTIGPGSDVMFDLVMISFDFYLYKLNPDLSRGTLWYHWFDSTSKFPTGVNISYYTVHHWFGIWEFVHGAPLDSTGYPHNITMLSQDARNHPAFGSESTFDDTTPASGDASNITGATATFGLPSGTNYLYTITTTGSGSALFDFRDPEINDAFFTGGWYRLNLGVHPKIQRYNGTTLAATYSATTGGGAGTYTLQLVGPDIYLKDSLGATLVHVNDGGPQSGVRVRINPSTQTVSWTGVVQ